MPPQRVKESCLPCRQRKSRCNAEIPCSSCVLRGTESDCQLPSQSGMTPAAARRPQKSTQHPHTSAEPSSSRRPSPEHRRSASPFHPDDMRHSIPRHRSSVEIPPPTSEERKHWEKVLAALPPRAACEILLEYMIQECDWLCHFGDIIGTFNRAIARGGVSNGVAGLLCMYIAIPALLVGDAQSPLYQPNIPTRLIHPRLFDLATLFSQTSDNSHDDLELALAIQYYILYSGLPVWSYRIKAADIKRAEKEGYFDESLDGWDGLNNEERNAKRRVGWGIISICRWRLMFLTTDPLAGVRINLCRPAMYSPQLTSPIHLPLPPRPGDEIEARFRVLRVKSSVEHGKVARYRDMIMDASETIPRVQTYLLRVGKVDMEVSLSECEALYRDLSAWIEEKIPAAGFERIPVDKIDFSDIASCRHTAQSLILHLAIGHISANVLRHWLSVGDVTPSSPSPHKRLYAACLDNAKKSMDHIPAVKGLAASRHGPLIAPFVAGNLFNAATSFAVPVLRAVKYWTSSDTEEDIRKLPIWPDHAYPSIGEARLDGSERFRHFTQGASIGTMRLPSNIYTDSSVRECATNILVILDALSELNANPLGQEAEKRLAALIHQYSLRDSQNVQAFDHWSLIGSTSLNTFPPTNPTLPVEGSAIGPMYGWYGYGPVPGEISQGETQNQPPSQGDGQEIEPGSDFNFLNSLLQMDGSVWEGLLEAGAITRSDGQPLTS